MNVQPSGRVHFTSRLPVEAQDQLETLLFFNEKQPHYRDVVVESIERFGEPRILRDGGLLRVHTARLGAVQSLFAVYRGEDAPRPIAVAVYTRTGADTMTLLHLAVDAQFATTGPLASEMVTLRLIREVVRSVSRIKGIGKVEMLYGAAGGTPTVIRVRSGTRQ